MRIIQSKGSTVVLRDRFHRVAAIILATACCSAGVMVAGIFAQRAVLDCDRETAIPTCEIRRQFLGRQETLAIGTPQRALIQESDDSEGGTTYRVAVQTHQGIYPITTYYSSGRNAKRQQRDQIERFIADPDQASLMVAIDNRWWAYPAGGVFALAGIAFILTFFCYTTYCFDRTYGHLSVERTILGLSQKKMTYALRDIQAITLEESTDSDGDPVCRISIFLNTGERLGSATYDNLNRAKKVQLVQTLNTYLGLLPPGR